MFRAKGERELSPPRRMERSGTLGIRINISAALNERKKRDPRQQKIVAVIEMDLWREFLYPPRRKILPLLESGAISYTFPGFRYAPPWAKLLRAFGALLDETFPGPRGEAPKSYAW